MSEKDHPEKVETEEDLDEYIEVIIEEAKKSDEAEKN